MADVNQQSQELAEVLARVNDELRQFGRVSEETQAALKAGSFRRAQEIDKASKLTADSLGELAGAGLAAAKSMYDGEKGAAAFNSALDGMSKAAAAAGAALTFMVPGGFLIKALIGLGTAAVTASLKLNQAASTMADQLFAANTKMAKSGAAASDGMMGMFRDAKKLGLSMKELGVYTDVVAANSAELALFRGTAFEGRKAFANIGAAMKPFRVSLEAAGISLEDQIEGTAGYLRLQTLIGQSQNKTNQELATGARKYLVEMDGLSKLTGMQRQEIEKQMESALSEQRFRAKLDAMRATKDPQQMAAADRLMRANILLSKQAPELGQAFRDIQSGALTSDAATKGLISTQGQLIQSSEALTSGQIDEYQAVKQIGGAIGQFNKDLNFTAQLGLLNDFAIDYAQGQKLAIFAQQDISKIAAEINVEQNKQLSGLGDANTRAMAELREMQRNANERFETTVSQSISTAIAMSKSLVGVTEPIATAFEKLQPVMDKFLKQMVKLTDWIAEKLGFIVGKTVDVVEATQKSGMAGFYRAGGSEAVGSGVGAGVGAAKGAAVGATLGSVVPVIGTAIGALLGGLVGGGAGYFFGKTVGQGADYLGKSVTTEPRAAGGPVRSRNPYIVGERGPELMVPEQSGRIINNDRLSQMFDGMSKELSSGMREMTMLKELSTGSHESLRVLSETAKVANNQFTDFGQIVKHMTESARLGGNQFTDFGQIVKHMTESARLGGNQFTNVNETAKQMAESARQGKKPLTGMTDSYHAIRKIVAEFEGSQDVTLNSVSSLMDGSENSVVDINKTYGSILKVIDNLSDKNKDTTAALIVTQKDTLTQSETIEKLTEGNAKRSKKFSDFFKTYVDKMTAAMDEDLNMVAGGLSGPGGGAGGDAAAGGGGGGGGGGSGGGGAGGGFISRLMSSLSAAAGGAGSAGSAGSAESAGKAGEKVNYDAEGRSGGGGGAAAPEQKTTPSGQQGRPRRLTEGVIYHHTGGRSLSAAVNTLKARGLAYHYMIDRDGSIVPFMDDNAVAYHAGPTDKNPKFGNWNTIGIAALANNNDDLTKEQLVASVKLNQQLSSKFGFSSQNIFGHGQVTSRKMADEGAGMVKAIQSGLSALNTTTGSEGPPRAESGGILTGPKEGYAAELHGTEAVVPLPGGKEIPVTMNREFTDEIRKFFQLQGQIDTLKFLKSDGGRDTYADVAPEIEAAQAKMFASLDYMKKDLLEKGYDKSWLENYGEEQQSKKNQVDLQSRYADDEKVVAAVTDTASANKELVGLVSQLLQAQQQQNNLQSAQVDLSKKILQTNY